MDTEKPPVTITGSLVQPRLQQTYAPTENERKLGALMQLGSHFWTPDFTPSQAQHLLADYLDDLSGASVMDVETACRDWRRDPKNTKFPRAANLTEIITKNIADRRENNRPKAKFQSRPIGWWGQPRKLWKPEWKESEVPNGQMVRDEVTDQLRAPRCW